MTESGKLEEMLSRISENIAYILFCLRRLIKYFELHASNIETNILDILECTNLECAGPSGRAVQGVGLRPLAC